MEYALIALIAFAIGFIVRGRLEKTSQKPTVKPKSGGGPGEENDQPGP